MLVIFLWWLSRLNKPFLEYFGLYNMLHTLRQANI
jgi:hypothetical protein